MCFRIRISCTTVRKINDAFVASVFLTWFQSQYTTGFSDLVITTNEICAASLFLFIPAVPPLLVFLGRLYGGDATVESDREWGVRLPAVTAPLPLAHAFPLFLSYLSQAVIQNPFSNGGSPAGEAVGGETRFAYFPATAVSDGTVSVQAAADPTLTQAGGESRPTLSLHWAEAHHTVTWLIKPLVWQKRHH